MSNTIRHMRDVVTAHWPLRSPLLLSYRAIASRPHVCRRRKRCQVFIMAAYSRIIEEESDDTDRYRALMHQLPRRFHELGRDGQAAVLLEWPPLTGSRWDVLLAAVVEQIARLHDHAIPAWVEEPERFLEDPWVIARSREIASESVLFAPGAFIRHSVFPDPLDLDARGGKTHVWVP